MCVDGAKWAGMCVWIYHCVGMCECTTVCVYVCEYTTVVLGMHVPIVQNYPLHLPSSLRG